MVFGNFLKKLTGSSPLSSDAKPLSQGTKDSILNAVGARSIPTMPAAAQKAFELSTNPKADARDFVQVIESDESLSARVLKVANSVYFDRGKPSKTIDEAVVTVGLNEVRSLLSANSLSEIFPTRHTARAQLWKNDVATAVFARMLASRKSAQLGDLSFLAGLMHDIGKLLLLQKNNDTYSPILQSYPKYPSSIQAEEEVYPFNHTQVGQLIGEKWGFEEDLLAAIRNHHEPWEKAHGPVTHFVKAGDLISHALGIGHPRGFDAVKKNAIDALPEMYDVLGIKGSENILDDARRVYDQENDRYGIG